MKGDERVVVILVVMGIGFFLPLILGLHLLNRLGVLRVPEDVG